MVDPTVPDSDLPPVGRSLFDHLFSENGAHRVPFPFPALMGMLGSQAGADALGRAGLKRVLIPLGRSLQRNAAAPQFFRFPRVVVAVDGESGAGPLLKDRLYIGYQEKAGVLEIISYNELAGRFEFQVVRNYRAGAAPSVYYANRAVCVACHQNHGPIFSRQQWDETNANPALSARIARHGDRYLGIRVERGVDEPYAIDNATDRANLLSATQRLWREGCGATDRDPLAVQCRAAAFTLMLQYRLTGRAQFDRDGPAYLEAFRPVLAANWKRMWPQGLAIPDPDLPNRSPLSLERNARSEIRAVDVSAPFDPLAPRAPLQTWSAANAEDLDQLVRGLAEFVSARDIQVLDRALLRQSARRGSRRVVGSCDFDRKFVSENRTRISFRCPSAQAREGLAMRGRIYVRGARVTGGSVQGLTVDRGGPLAALEVIGGRASTKTASFDLKGAQHWARTQQGDRIERLELSWTTQPVRVVVTIREDFALAEEAIERLAQRTISGNTDAFSDRPFRRSVLMASLIAELGGQVQTQCCDRAGAMPEAALEPAPPSGRDGRSAAADSASLAAFDRACGRCHSTADPFPPNFLAGDAVQAASNLKQCAERIYVRLQMWRAEPDQRLKTPMPPVLALPSLGATPQKWLTGGELDALLKRIEGVLSAESRAPPRLQDYEDRGYENLRACLVAGRLGADARRHSGLHYIH